ncbi:uncharacterized protein LOC132951097 [Metopolophium dirhodum]|uniref:uncharacterized protein LOC132951097 n=1 Tax=Metopolophium dirhodum TaxID=44670 RepID=UPI00299037E4|nr:uncharacterized protein LOC132951097 [Metopolophium dirhodum]
MLAKIFLVVFLTTGVMTFAKDENELVSSALGTGTTFMKEASKYIADDPDKYSVDLNALYKKYEIGAKAEQARNMLQAQIKKSFEMTNDYVKKLNIDGEEHLKKSIDIIKKEDSVLGDKLTKFYDKSCELDRISEDIIKYVLDADKFNGALDKAKSALRPIEHKLADSIKKFETIVLEHLPKKGKK